MVRMADKFMDLVRQAFGARPQGDSFLTVHLEEAFARPGCPLCRLAAEATRRGLEALLYEYVNDPGTHEQLLASRGYCTEHTWAVPVAEAAIHSPSGVAIVYERLLAEALRHADRPGRLARWLEPEAACPACATAESTAEAYLAELGRVLGRRPSRLDRRPAALCRPHLRASAGEVDERARRALAGQTAQALGAAGGADRLALLVGHHPLGKLPTDQPCPACRAAATAVAAIPDLAALCRRHAWALHDGGRREVADQLERVVAEGDACPACRVAVAAAGDAVAALDDEDAARLCLGHLRLALQGGWPVLAPVTEALTQLDADLRRFAASFDYRFTGALSEAERRSWVAVLERFGGQAVGAAAARPLPFVPAGRDAEAHTAAE